MRICLNLILAAVCCPALLIGTRPSTAAGPTYTDPQQAGEDYALQGEYSGEIETDEGPTKVGVQVIAMGEGDFQAVAYVGGLPGQDIRPETAHRIGGQKNADGVVVFRGEHATGRLHDGQMEILSEQGQALGTLKKTERKSPTLGKQPPEGATVLFDGSSADQWNRGRMTDDHLLMQGTTSKPTFQSQRVHIEFRLPFQPQERGQARGNSGIYLQGRYEVQMLDSFGLEGENNECGGIYEISAPRVNMCFPPLTWQTYDIEFHAARYSDQGELTTPPRITVYHNGVLIQEDVELPRATRAAPRQPGPEPGPIYLQDHGTPVRYRNIWVVPMDS